MCRYTLSLVFLFLITGIHAQDQNQAILDSLWLEHADPKTSADARLEALDNIIYHMSYIDQDSCVVLSRQMVNEARAAGNVLMLGQAFRNYGIALFRSGAGEGALPYMDSSLQALSTRQDSAYSRGAGATLSSIGTMYQSMGDLNSAISNYQQSVERHLAANNPRGLVFCYNNIGVAHETQGRSDSSLIYYERAAELATELGLDEMASTGYSNMANVHAEVGRIGEAIDLVYKAMAIAERIGSKSGIANCLSQISDLKARLGEKTESLALLRHAYALFHEADDREGAINAGGSIGALLMELGKLDSAVIMLETALALEREGGYKHLMDHTLLDLGAAYRRSGRRPEAEKVLQEALGLAREVKDATQESMVLSELGMIDLNAKNSDRAIERCKKGLILAERTGARNARQNNCECLYLAYRSQGNGTQALRYHEAFIGVRDSLTNEKSQRQLTQRDLLYTFGKQQLADSLAYSAEREQLESERTIEALRADQNRNRAFGIGAGAVLLVIGGGAWFVADRKRRQERFEKEAATLETQALRSQMNPHFIFNALNSINAFVQRNDQDSATSYLSKFARVMRLVLENSRHAEVPLNDDLEALRGYLDLERMRMEKKFDFTITVDPGIDPENVMVPPLVVQPFVENAIWHGMAGKEGKGHITLTVAERNGQMRWTIEDDGAGRQAKKTPPLDGKAMKKTSLGTAITRARLDLVQKQHGGKAGFHYTDLPQGTRVEVDMPILKMHDQ
ncbi:MAG: tetratricopeptide repeat protein [Flavobacteriales bacterium]|nr:tetratricopeptide repeat protein [Flavobacteriales bacterium]MBK6945227.1 tetratricopeptide repeat protein [Flavobacteriales bacterium]MBK7239576.1 tetratricopeptide repeat protein [Flavobacteriales bacterium]MBK9535217.1 tetratricopeptide repeat protein [Flavobacteriales bacterium]MBP9137807.1 tetratricopeptide repeat protein [Flavobacteriales bacterium]